MIAHGCPLHGIHVFLEVLAANAFPAKFAMALLLCHHVGKQPGGPSIAFAEWMNEQEFAVYMGDVADQCSTIRIGVRQLLQYFLFEGVHGGVEELSRGELKTTLGQVHHAPFSSEAIKVPQGELVHTTEIGQVERRAIIQLVVQRHFSPQESFRLSEFH